MLFAYNTRPNMKTILFALILASLITHFALQAITPNKLTTIELKLTELVNCEQTNSCPQSSNPRNSYYLLGEKINQQLNEVITLQKLHGETPEIVALAQRFYQHSNELVQLKALSLIAQQSPNELSANLLLSQLNKIKDNNLVIATLTELQKYPNKSTQVDQVISHILTFGSFSAAKVLANNIAIQLSANNIEFYQSLLQKLPVNSVKTSALKTNIINFKKNN